MSQMSVSPPVRSAIRNLRIDGASTLGTRIYPLADHQNSEAYNGFHRAFIPDIFKKEE